MTNIYNSYSDFLDREDLDDNGVSPEFAAEHPDFVELNLTNKSCWDCSGCSDCSGCWDCSGCSRCSVCSGCSGCSRCSDCSGCWDCSRCSDCSDCSGCSRCSRCSRCSDSAPQPIDALRETPIIPSIHAAVLEAATVPPEALDMSLWHAECGTTHCRAGWVVTLAGERGKALESLTSTLHASMMIYHASCPKVPVSPNRFFETNEKAIADMRRCAELEAALRAKPK